MTLFDLTLRLRFAKPLLAGVVALACLGAPAHAQSSGLGVDKKGADRIWYTALISALSQRVASATCFAEAGINPAKYHEIAAGSLSQGTVMLAGLENGNDALGLVTPEETRKVLNGLYGVNKQWQPYAAAATNLADDSATADEWSYVSRHNLNVMHATKYLVGELMAEYANPPELLQSFALTLDIAGRQMGLSQQILKETCGINTGNAVLGHPDRLKNASRLFDASLNALRNGLDAAGVLSPPTPEIKDALDQAAADWDLAKAELAMLDGAGSLDPAAAEAIFARMDGLYIQFFTIAELYVAASKTGL